MALIPERIFEKYLLSESEPFLPEPGEDIEMDHQRFPGSGSSSQTSQTPMLGENALNDGDSQQGSPQFETLQACQAPTQSYQNEDSQQSNFEDWACGDFDLFEFIGSDEPDQPFSGSNYIPNGNQQPESSGKEEKDDYMYGIMQYNDMIYDNSQQQHMYGHHDVNGSFFPDDRYQQNTSSASGPLNNAINKLHQQQSQQPSTSRLSSIVSDNQARSSYSSRMRPQLANTLGQSTQMNGDLAESVLLPTSSTSPPSGMFMQTMIKQEPTQYNTEDYVDSTSDNDSHYSGGFGGRLAQPTSKPRKYRIKPDSEKVNPQYKMKRAKNNDAVRRSREKAKHAQLEKEKRLNFLESEHNEYYKQVNVLKQRIRELESENDMLRKNCNCGGIQQQMFRR